VSLILPTPSGLPPAVENAFDEVLPPLQTWAGKVDGIGKWVDATIDSTILRVDYAGNSWSIGSMNLPTASYCYTIVGSTMVLSLFLFNTALTIGTAVNSLYVRIPDGYRATLAPKSGLYTRSIVNVGWGNLSGTPEALYLTVSDRRWIGVARLSFTNWATLATLTVAGQIAFEVEPI
jgi:hypothetical protein